MGLGSSQLRSQSSPSRYFLRASPSSARPRPLAMLDLITMISAVGLQQELGQDCRDGKGTLVIKATDNVYKEGGGFLEETAEQLSSIFDGFESTLAKGASTLFEVAE